MSSSYPFSILTKAETILFNNFKNNSRCQLKNFINLLYYIGFKKPLSFDYISPDAALHPSLSLKENIFLDSIPTSLTSTKEFVFQEYLAKNSNNYLLEVYSQIENIDKLPCAVSNQSKKLTSILKALVSERPIIFLEMPEKNLCPQNQLLVYKAFEMSQKLIPRNLIIYTHQPEIWKPLIQKTITKNKDNSYQINKDFYLSSDSKDRAFSYPDTVKKPA